MKRQRRGRPPHKGFTLAEVLITVAVVSIGFLGTMAALAFGMTASRDTSQHTQALNYNRRMIELLYNNVVSVATVIQETNPADPARNYADATTEEADWRRLYYQLVVNPLPTGLTDWFDYSDWFADQVSPEAVAFQRDSQKYRVNITKQRNVVGGAAVTNTTDPKYHVVRVVLVTRWRERMGGTDNGGPSKWRSVRTEMMVNE